MNDELGPMSNLESAFAYLALGWHVFRLSPGSKQPLPGTRGFLDASNDYTIVARWWTDMPTANIGIACGPLSGVWCLDIDAKHDGHASLVTLAEEIGEEFLDCRTHTTAGGGLHLMYRWDASCPMPRKINLLKSQGLTGIDLIGSDGYIVAPRSTVDGRVYTVADDRDPEAASSALVEKIQSVLRPGIAGPSMGRDGIAAPARHGTSGIVSWLVTVPPGDQDNAASWVARALRDEGLRPEETADLLWSSFCQMQTSGRPWTEADVRRHVRSAYQGS